MALKNYTTKVSADRSASEIQTMLVRAGAEGVLFEYEKGTGRIESISFRINIGEQVVGFRLPNKWRSVGLVLIEDGVRRAENDEDYVYRVAWRILRDWIDAQMALLKVQMVDLEQIFLPYAIQSDGRTVYDHMRETRFQLTDGK